MHRYSASPMIPMSSWIRTDVVAFRRPFQYSKFDLFGTSIILLVLRAVLPPFDHDFSHATVDFLDTLPRCGCESNITVVVNTNIGMMDVCVFSSGCLFASMSAVSLPKIPSYARIQRNSTWIPSLALPSGRRRHASGYT